MAKIFEKVALENGRASNKFSFREILPDLFGGLDLSNEGVLKEESKP